MLRCLFSFSCLVGAPHPCDLLKANHSTYLQLTQSGDGGGAPQAESLGSSSVDFIYIQTSQADAADPHRRASSPRRRRGTPLFSSPRLSTAAQAPLYAQIFKATGVRLPTHITPHS